MKLNRTGSNWNRLERNKINENWDIIEGSYNDVVGQITDEVVGHLIDSARLDWKEPVDTVDDLPTNAEVGETRMVREADPDGISYVYRYDGEEWEKIQAIDVTLVNEVDNRLSAQLAETVGDSYKFFNPPLQADINSYFSGGNAFAQGDKATYDEYVALFENLYMENQGYITRYSKGFDSSGWREWVHYVYEPKSYSRTIVIGAGMHGGEKLAVISLYNFLKLLVDNWKEHPQLARSEEHTSELQSRGHLVCRLLLEKKKQQEIRYTKARISSNASELIRESDKETENVITDFNETRSETIKLQTK